MFALSLLNPIIALLKIWVNIWWAFVFKIDTLSADYLYCKILFESHAQLRNDRKIGWSWMDFLFNFGNIYSFILSPFMEFN